MKGLTVELIGKDQVVGTLRRLNVVAVARVTAVIKLTALTVASDAKRRAPVDTGRLRSSIRPTFYEDGLWAHVGTDVEYAPFVEYGTGRGGAGSGVTPRDGYSYGPSVGMRAKPFLFPAWEAARAGFTAAIAAALQGAINEAS